VLSAFFTRLCRTVSEPASVTLVRANRGDPAPLDALWPVACNDLIRLGSRNDGGYVIPLRAVEAANALLSFGLSHDWNFEREFQKRNPEVVIHCYDHTVSLLSAAQYSIRQVVKAIVRRDIGSLRRSAAWADYLIFFRDKRKHFRERAWMKTEDGSVSASDSVARLPNDAQIFVKMDIEGAEYRVLPELLDHSGKIVALAVEFHDVDLLSENFNTLIEAIKKYFYIVHVHGNNMGGTTPSNFPIALEITFLNKRLFAEPPAPSQASYPMPGLDRPNHPGLPDYAFEFSSSLGSK